MRVAAPRFSSHTLDFLRKASRQKLADWLDRNRDGFEAHVRGPLQHLAGELARELRSNAPGYHFPLKGLGRIKRSEIKAREYGSHYKSYASFTITKPSKSRFDHNPSVFFMINSEDGEGDELLLAGGLYLPSSRQLKTLRERIAENAAPFEQLFRSAAFARSFPEGFSDERTATRPPRGFDQAHPKMRWLKLQGFFVWRSYRKREYSAADFPKLVARDARQILRLNELLDRALTGRWPEKTARNARGTALPAAPSATPPGFARVSEGLVLPQHDF